MINRKTIHKLRRYVCIAAATVCYMIALTGCSQNSAGPCQSAGCKCADCKMACGDPCQCSASADATLKTID